MKLRTLILNLSVPIQKQMQKLHPPYPQTTIKMAEDAMLSMQDGDIVLSREAWHFTNYFVPGFWGHAAIYGQGQVVEAVAPSVQVVDWRDWVMTKHSWCVVRPLQADPSSGRHAFNWAMSKLGALYDYDFSGDNKLFYCSELAFDAWEANSQWAKDAFTRKTTLGEWTVTPEDFYQAAYIGKLKMIHEHRDK
jgi:uncharacterized protein YycO